MSTHAWYAKPRESYLAGIIMALLLATVAWWGLSCAWRQYAIGSWPETQAVILRMDDGVHEGGEGVNWYANPNVEFQYHVDGQRYTSTRLSPSPFNYLSASHFQRELGQLARNAVTTCRVNPADPAEAYLLNSGITAGPVIVAFIGLLGTGFVLVRMAQERWYLIDLVQEDAPAAALQTLTAQPARIRSVSLRRCRLDGTAVAALNACPRLAYLRLADCAVDDGLLARLTVCNRVVELDLSDNPITDEGFEHLHGRPSLKVLWLAGTCVTDESCQQLAKFPELTFLDLSQTPVTDQATENLLRLLKLTHLNLTDTRIGDASLERIVHMEDIHHLDLSGTDITATSAERLKRLQLHDGFKELRLSRTDLSESEIAELREHLWPNRVVG